MTQIELLNRLNDLVGEFFIGVISKNDVKVGIRRAIEEYDSDNACWLKERIIELELKIKE